MAMLGLNQDAVINPAQRRRLVRALRAFLPEAAVLHTEETLKPYECDGLTVFRALPMLVVRPTTESDVCRVLAICAEIGVPVVARGAGTGLSGGATPIGNGVLMSLAALNRIIAIDPLARIATVEPGVTNLAISQAVASHGLYYAPDPSSQIACSIGGNVAENSGGVHCLKYGLTVHNVLKLRVAMMDGTLVELGSAGCDCPGYDLLALLHGSEGLLGVITEITVKLLPKPAEARVVMAAFDTISAAASAVARIIASGIVPAGLELMDHAATNAVETFAHAGYPLDAQAILLCESDGASDEVNDEIECICAILTDCGASTLRVSSSAEERLQLWAGRKAAFPAIGKLSPDYYCVDGTIPRRHVADVLQRIEALSQHFGLRCANVFHAGDGNLHPLIMFDAALPDEVERAEAFGNAILMLCLEVGGSITGEHGVGLEKLDAMCAQFESAELASFHALKHAFDPLGRLNPGKAVPLPHRCGEVAARQRQRQNPQHTNLPVF
jgi:glycolate oxidase